MTTTFPATNVANTCKTSEATCAFYPQRGLAKQPSDFMVSKEDHTLSARIERAIKWILAKSLRPDQLSVLGVGDWELLLSEMQNDMPIFPFVKHNDNNTAFIVVVNTPYTIWTKLKRMLLKCPDEIPPYYVIAAEKFQYGPLFHLRWRLAGYHIQAGAISLQRHHIGEIEFNRNHNGIDNHYAYTFCIKARVADPIRFYEFCSSAQESRTRFEEEIRLILWNKIERAYIDNFYNPPISLAGTLSTTFLHEIGYSDVEYELNYESN